MRCRRQYHDLSCRENRPPKSNRRLGFRRNQAFRFPQKQDRARISEGSGKLTLCTCAHILHGIILIHVDRMEHDLRKLRVKLGPHTLDKLFPDLFLGHGIPIAPLGGHGVVGVRNADDAGEFRDLLSLQAVRIP